MTDLEKKNYYNILFGYYGDLLTEKQQALFEEYYGEEMITEVFLTSIAAAYCDLGEFDKAKLCCNKAFKLSGCVCSDELQAVYDRIKGCYK